MRNPDWTRDELILALDAYFQVGRRQPSPGDVRVVELSQLLQQLAIHPPKVRGGNFRNPQSVSMKLGNIASVDPMHTGPGLSRGSALDRTVWDEFAHDPDHLHTVARAIRQAYQHTKSDDPRDLADTEEEFAEGRLLTRLHIRKERNSAAVKRKKELVLKQTGALACEVCGFDFHHVYGDLGTGFVECHHTTPIAELDAGHRTKLEDLALVCANCHRMLHQHGLKTLAQLRAQIHAIP